MVFTMTSFFINTGVVQFKKKNEVDFIIYSCSVAFLFLLYTIKGLKPDAKEKEKTPQMHQ